MDLFHAEINSDDATMHTRVIFILIYFLELVAEWIVQVRQKNW